MSPAPFSFAIFVSGLAAGIALGGLIRGAVVADWANEQAMACVATCGPRGIRYLKVADHAAPCVCRGEP